MPAHSAKTMAHLVFVIHKRYRPRRLLPADIILNDSAARMSFSSQNDKRKRWNCTAGCGRASTFPPRMLTFSSLGCRGVNS